MCRPSSLSAQRVRQSGNLPSVGRWIERKVYYPVHVISFKKIIELLSSCELIHNQGLGSQPIPEGKVFPQGKFRSLNQGNTLNKQWACLPQSGIAIFINDSQIQYFIRGYGWQGEAMVRSEISPVPHSHIEWAPTQIRDSMNALWITKALYCL